jgi:hypothetical protein
MSTRVTVKIDRRRRAALLAALAASGLSTLAQVAAQAADESEMTALEPGTPTTEKAPSAERATPATSLEVPVREANEHRAGNLFAAHSWYTPPPPPPPRAPPPPPEPTAPALPFTYLGSLQQGDTTVYFLVRGDRAYDVKIGDVLDNTYSVDGISNGQLMFTYLPLKTRQTLQLGEAK